MTRCIIRAGTTLLLAYALANLPPATAGDTARHSSRFRYNYYASASGLSGYGISYSANKNFYGVREGNSSGLFVLVPIHTVKEKEDISFLANTVYVSPTERYMILSWKVINGVNGVVLCRLVSRRGNGQLVYRATKYNHLADQAAMCAAPNGMYAHRFFVPTGWHGFNDRYLDLDLKEIHGPTVWRASYDTARHRFIEHKPADFGPYSPRVTGEKFPQTRTRRLTAASVAHWNYAQVRYAINEMYARQGFRFDDDEAVQRHFEKMDWYWRDDGLYRESSVARTLSPIERSNLTVLTHRRDTLIRRYPKSPEHRP